MPSYKLKLKNTVNLLDLYYDVYMYYVLLCNGLSQQLFVYDVYSSMICIFRGLKHVLSWPGNVLTKFEFGA